VANPIPVVPPVMRATGRFSSSEGIVCFSLRADVRADSAQTSEVPGGRAARGVAWLM